jgi:hypothetical protein
VIVKPQTSRKDRYEDAEKYFELDGAAVVMRLSKQSAVGVCFKAASGRCPFPDNKLRMA